MKDYNMEEFLNRENRHMGYVKAWFQDRGFGFIRDIDTGKEYFAHYKKVADGMLYSKSVVEFSVGINKRTDKEEAYNVLTVELPEERHIRY